MDEKMVEIAFQLISHGGNARGMAMEAINAAKQNNIAEAKDLINRQEKRLRQNRWRRAAIDGTNILKKLCREIIGNGIIE